jgi:DNA-binding IclR family transcriptional regulator
LTEDLIKAELERTSPAAQGKRPSWKQVEAMLAEVRERGLARAVGHPIPGINAFCAPVFDHTRNIVLAITVLGPAGTFDAQWNGPIARAVLETAASVSARLGYRR